MVRKSFGRELACSLFYISLLNCARATGVDVVLVRLYLACLFLPATTVSTSLSQQSFGSIKGIVTDQLGALVANAKIIVRDGNGEENTVNTNATGNYWFRNLRPGKYELLVIAPGFTLFEKQNVIVAAGGTIDLDIELSVGLEEESVTIDERGVSTDADRNADALVLRGRELEALPTDPEALIAALQAMAGPGAEDQSGAQVTVDGFSGGQIPPKEAIREVRINQNPFSAEYEFPGFGGIQIFTQPGSDKWHGGANFRFNDESLNSRNPFSPRRAPYQQRSFGGNLTGPIIKKRASFAFPDHALCHGCEYDRQRYDARLSHVETNSLQSVFRHASVFQPRHLSRRSENQ